MRDKTTIGFITELLLIVSNENNSEILPFLLDEFHCANLLMVELESGLELFSFSTKRNEQIFFYFIVSIKPVSAEVIIVSNVYEIFKAYIISIDTILFIEKIEQ